MADIHQVRTAGPTEKIEKRQSSNRELIRVISAAVEAYPELRFHQILHSLNIVQTEMVHTVDVSGEFEIPGRLYAKDKFHEESVDTLKGVRFIAS